MSNKSRYIQYLIIFNILSLLIIIIELIIIETEIQKQSGKSAGMIGPGAGSSRNLPTC